MNLRCDVQWVDGEAEMEVVGLPDAQVDMVERGGQK